MMARLKPMQLVWFICISNMTATLAVVGSALKAWHLPENRLPPDVRSFGIATISISVAAALVAEWTFQRRVRSNAWTDELLAWPRKCLFHPVLITFIATMIVLSILSFIVAPLRNSSLGILFLCLPLSLIRMSTPLKPKETRTEVSSGSALYPAKPLQSDQWGR